MGWRVTREADQVTRLAETLADCSWRDQDGAVRLVECEAS
jgi:hypothetical protein